jgi:phage minor structural protein
MIKVFNAHERVFTNNGDKILQPLKAVILKEDNGDYELELETRIEDKDYIVNDKIIVCDTPWGKQGFRVYNPQKKSNKITCTCKHLFYDTASYLIADAYVVDKNCNDALDHLNNACDTVTPFTTISDIQTVTSYRATRKTLEEAISVVLERWGGHLVRDNFHIEIRREIGADRGVTLRYGKNIEDIQVKEDWSGVVTKILPVGKDGLLLDDKYITTADLSPNEANYGLLYDKPYTKTVSFTQDIPEDEYKVDGVLDEGAYAVALKQDLKDQAIAYIRENCLPKINYTLKANIPLLGDNEQTDIGDTIEVYDERLGINLMTSIISVKWDCLQGRFVEVNFGNFSKKLKNLVTETTSATKKEVKEAVNNEVIPQVETKLQEAYTEIWDALDNSYCVYDGDKILILDALPKEQAKNCIMLNSGGISFSKNGINGQFTSAWTIDGTLNMQAINVINLVADMIKGGTLKLGSENAQQGRLELYDEANKLIGEMNSNGLTMYAKDGSYIKINNEVGFAGYDKNNNKIYWVDGETFCTKKFIANEEITVGGKLRMLPITTSTNSGIGFVAIYTGN